MSARRPNLFVVGSMKAGTTSPALWIVDLESGAAARLDTPGIAGA